MHGDCIGSVQSIGFGSVHFAAVWCGMVWVATFAPYECVGGHGQLGWAWARDGEIRGRRDARDEGCSFAVLSIPRPAPPFFLSFFLSFGFGLLAVIEAAVVRY
ncbi:uncharacterized protein J3D65DRAFT_642696 [Phyllosticta citribraziliensis]|uniref:Uncharacterized protein n=1 Tax=Phyllosticta citribraziliensis TaxID=989973 RepID=A0ABR1L5E8_9PEZI